MKKPRHLSPDEKALWDQVAERTTPMKPEVREAMPQVFAKPAKRPKPAAPITDFQVGSKVPEVSRNDFAPSIGMQLRSAPVQMDNKSFGRMTRGKIKPEARIDLHGMTIAEAHPELTSFILRAEAAGKRLVLVITGKGKRRDEGGPMPVRQGVLRHQVPQWLALPPLSSVVLQVTPANIRHGGDGAYYVYLRRRR